MITMCRRPLLILLGFLVFQLTAADKLIDVNTATEQEISALPGVDQDLAKKIVENRPYASVEDLRRSGISPGLLEQIAPRITVSRIQSEPHGGQAGLISEAKPSSPQLERAHVSAQVRVAILDFDYATVRTASSAVFGRDVDIGKGIADILGRHLGKDSSYVVIERASVDRLLAGQDFSSSGQGDPAAIEHIGKLLGVDAVIVGSITQFGRDDKASGGGLGRFATNGIGKRSSKAVVGISARVVDVKTGEIVAAVEGNGESLRSGTTLLGAENPEHSGGTSGVDMSSKSFEETILGEATTQAVGKLVAGLDWKASDIPAANGPSIDGLVADVNGASLVLNIGSGQGLRVGDRLVVWRETQSIRDPATGATIKHIEAQLGEITITGVKDGTAVATYHGKNQLRPGDRVKR